MRGSVGGVAGWGLRIEMSMACECKSVSSELAIGLRVFYAIRGACHHVTILEPLHRDCAKARRHELLVWLALSHRHVIIDTSTITFNSHGLKASDPINGIHIHS